MTRRVVLITQDSDFEMLIKMSSLTLTKLNYQVDIFQEIRKDIDLIIIDFDIKENFDLVKSIRANPEFKNKKIVGVATALTDKKIFFDCGCDSVMSKKEFAPAADNILMY
ncbi:MAG: hypothetical protein HY959_06600 [Ignavibacteriae bacterium]|nr:hypothetical protein [Ignavibacteriota bacterium]